MCNYLSKKYRAASSWSFPSVLLIAIIITVGSCNPNKQTHTLQQDCVNNTSLTSLTSLTGVKGTTQQKSLKLNDASGRIYHKGDTALVGGYLEVDKILSDQKVRGVTSDIQVITRSALFEVEFVDSNKLLVRAWGVFDFPLARESHKVRMKFDAYNPLGVNNHLENPLNSYLSQELYFPRQNEIDNFISEKIVTSNDEEDRILKTYLLNQRIADGSALPLSRSDLVGYIDANNTNPWCAKPELTNAGVSCAPFYTNRILNFEIDLSRLSEVDKSAVMQNVNVIFDIYALKDATFGSKSDSELSALEISLKKWRYLMQWQRAYDDLYGIYQLFSSIEHCKNINDAGSVCVLLKNNLDQVVSAIEKNFKYMGINGRAYSLTEYLSAADSLTSVTNKSFTSLINRAPILLADADLLDSCKYSIESKYNANKCNFYDSIFPAISSAVNAAQVQGEGSALFLDYLKKSNRALLEQTQTLYLEIVKGIQNASGLELGVATNWLRKKDGILSQRFLFQNILAESSSDAFFANDPISNDIKIIQVPFKGFDSSVSGATSSQVKFEFQVLRSSEENKDTFSFCDQVGALLMIDGKHPLHVLSSVNSICKKTNGYSEVNIGAVDESVPDEYEVSAQPRPASSDNISDINCK